MLNILNSVSAILTSMEEIAKLLNEGKSPSELVAMGYPKSTVYTVKKKLSKKDTLAQLATQLMHKRKGTIEIVLCDLIMQAIRTNDHLTKILKICEAVSILGEEEKQAIFTREEIEELERIHVVALALQSGHWIVADPETGMKCISVFLPAKLEEIGVYLKFLEDDPEALGYVSYHTGYHLNEDHRRKIKEEYGPLALMKMIFYHSIKPNAYNALVMYFVKYALPRVLSALRKIADLIQPSILSSVLSIYGGARNEGAMGKR